MPPPILAPDLDDANRLVKPLQRSRRDVLTGGPGTQLAEHVKRMKSIYKRDMQYRTQCEIVVRPCDHLIPTVDHGVHVV